jgi:cytidylate kinase
MIIAIDGPAGSGKSTISRLLASRIGFLYLDTGATYRAVGLAVHLKTGKKDNFTVEEILKILEEITLNVDYDGGKFRIFLNGEDISEKIRTEEVGKYASLVAQFPQVKEKLFELQRKIVNNTNAVVEGRDAGLYVFPDADIKIFLTASPEVRAQRRYKELKEKGINVSYKEILKAVIERDKRDRNRRDYPFKPAEDAIVIDTSELSLEEVFNKIWKIVEPHLNLFITGIGSGLGKALAKEYLGRGYKVYALSRNLPDELKNEPNLVFEYCDLSRLEEVYPKAEKLLRKVNKNLPWVILNAGVLGELKEMREVSLKELKEVMDINVWANKVIFDLLEDLEKEGTLKVGQIIAISSGAAVNCNKGWNGYSLSKATLNCLVKLYHWEFPNSHLVSLAPGLIWTPMLRHIVEEVDADRFPSVKRLQQSPKLSPKSAAKMLSRFFTKLAKYPSGSFVDVRKEAPELYENYLDVYPNSENG